MATVTVEEALTLARQHVQSGRLAEAEEICQAILKANGEVHPAHQLSAIVAHLNGRTQRAVELLDQAIKLAPDVHWYHDNRAVMLHALGRFAEAETASRKAVQLSPDFAEGRYNLALALKELGRIAEAEESYRQAIAIRPNYPQALNNLGNLLRARGKLDEAESVCRLALEQQPNMAEAANNLGTILQAKGKLADAVAAYQQALATKPDFAEAANNLGTALQATRQLESAAAAYRWAIELRPNFVEAINNLGSVQQAQGRTEEAERSYRQALQLRPRFAEAYARLAETLEAQARLEESEAAARSAIAIDPDRGETLGTLGKGLHAQGRIAEAAAAYAQALSKNGDMALVRSNALFCMQYRPDITPEELAVAHDEWDQRHGQPLRSTWQPFENSLDPNRPLRIGFVSADFGNHPVGYFLIRTLEEADRSDCTTFCYSDRIEQDDFAVRLRGATDHWIDVRELSDEALVERIRADRIDILIDLAGHTGRNRLLAFARRPAPVQATWIGYVGTTGLEAIDYLIADQYHIPAGAEADYRETVVRMPDGYVCFCPPDDAPPVSPLPAIANGYVTFGCFNNTAKINAQVINLWTKLLHRVPGSRLVLKYQWLEDAATRKRMARQFADAGVDPERIELNGWSPRLELLANYGRIDIALDPFPYSGGLTTCEALWMGVPVVTCPGKTFASRHSYSHLANVGLSEFVAQDLDEYVEIAAGFANDFPRLAKLRGEMRERVRTSPLCDGSRFARHWQAAMRTIWQEWVRRQVAAKESQSERVEQARSALQANDPARAKSICASILSADPRSADGLRFLGLAEYYLGNVDGAIQLLEQSLAETPSAPVYDNLSFILLERRLYSQAEAVARRAVELSPESANALNNLGRALNAQGEYRKAESAFRRAIELKPDFPEPYSNLANALCESGAFGEAESAARRAVEIGPPSPLFFNNLANVLLNQTRHVEAEAASRSALELDDTFASAWSNLGCALMGQGKIGAAETATRRACELSPMLAEGHNNLGHVLLAKGLPSEATASFLHAVELEPAFAVAHGNYLQASHYVEKMTLPELARRHEEWERLQCSSIANSERFKRRTIRAPDRLRIGFVSPDLGLHPVGYFLARPLAFLDRTRFETFAYSDRWKDDEYGRKLLDRFEHSLRTIELSDAQLWERIRSDEIDILVDLAGHTKGNRMRLFARRAAPMQVSWIGYVGTTGVTAMDYLIADRRHIPPEAEQFYRERLILLPDGYVCFDPPPGISAAPEPPVLRNDRITFGCFNNTTKIQSELMETWGSILRSVPDSRLYIAYRGADDPDVRRRIVAGLESHGVHADRITCAAGRARADLLSAYSDIDIALDTFPYSGGVTTCEALWMGVPVITCPGSTFAGRHSLSHLSNVGLHELIASNRDDYIAIVVALANDRERLIKYRREIRPQMEASPLCDGERFARHLADALANAWEQLGPEGD